MKMVKHESPEWMNEWMKAEMYRATGGDLGGLGGRSPQNLRLGTAHAFVPPIFWELTLSEFLVRKEITCYFTDKRHKTQSMTKKKKVIRDFWTWNGNCSKKVIRKFDPRIFPSPQNSAPSLRVCVGRTIGIRTANLADIQIPKTYCFFMSKIIEKIFAYQVTVYLEINKFLAEGQFGFRRRLGFFQHAVMHKMCSDERPFL